MNAVTLALDLGTNMGFAIARADNRIESGAKNFPLIHGHEGRRFIDFRAWLIDKVRERQPARLVYERVFHVGEKQAYAAQLYGGFLAVVLMVCEHYQLPHEGFQISEIKKAWTGKGNADKDQMVARCKELGFAPGSPDEADAIAILHVGTGTCPPVPIERRAEKFKRKPKAKRDTSTAPIQFNEVPF